MADPYNRARYYALPAAPPRAAPPQPSKEDLARYWASMQKAYRDKAKLFEFAYRNYDPSGDFAAQAEELRRPYDPKPDFAEQAIGLEPNTDLRGDLIRPRTPQRPFRGVTFR